MESTFRVPVEVDSTETNRGAGAGTVYGRMEEMAEYDDELRALRERAYGPRADIQDDPQALSRLHELESLAAAAPLATRVAPPSSPASEPGERPLDPDEPAGGPPASEDGPSDIPAVDPPHAPFAEASPGPLPRGPETVDASETRGDEASARRPWWKRRMPLLWACSVLAAAVLGAVSATGVQSLVTGQVAVLDLDATTPWPESFFGSRPDGGRMFDEFEGLTVLAVPQEFGDRSATACLYVLSGTDPQPAVATAGCAAGSFDPTAALLVSAQSPDALLARFPEGTALQFRLDGSRVAVYAARD